MVKHLHSLVQSVNADYSGRAYNFDSARTHHPLFRRSRGVELCRKKYGSDLPGRISELRTSSFDEDMNSDPVRVYQSYLSLCADTGIRFIHTGLHDYLLRDPGTQRDLATHLDRLKMNDPQFGDKAGALIKRPPLGSPRSLGFLNIWIVELPHALLGYSTFPWDNAGAFDGVCICPWVAGTRFEEHGGIDFKRYALYKTLTHEIAHTLGALHTFNQDIQVDPVTHEQRHHRCNDDFVDDTPDQDKATQGDVFQKTEWPVDARPGAQPYQFMNFMDYTNDPCMFMFTEGQKTRMRQVILGYRQGWTRVNGEVQLGAPEDGGRTTLVTKLGRQIRGGRSEGSQIDASSSSTRSRSSSSRSSMSKSSSSRDASESSSTPRPTFLQFDPHVPSSGWIDWFRSFFG